MEIIFVALGIAAIAYVIAIMAFNGMVTFLWFWPFFAVVHFLMYGLTRYVKKKRRAKEVFPLQPVVFVFASYGFFMTLLVATLLFIVSGAHSREEKNLDYVIVMGASLQDNRVSTSLKRRLDRAIEYSKDNPETIFVLSGGRNDYDRSTEATVMYYYMIQRGVPADNLLLEFYSKSTREKIGFSLAVIEQDNEQKMADDEMLNAMDAPPGIAPEDILHVEHDKPLSIGIITSEFNMFRARRTAQRLGVPNPCPITTRTDELMLVHWSTREAIAIIKDRIAGNI